MAKKLVIVESPAKAKTIGKYLGKDFSVKASIGHIKDLPVKTLGVDLEKDFEPTYEVIKGKKKVIDEIKSAASKAEAVYIATDPDREGEAIAWHIAEEIQGKAKKPSPPKKTKKTKTKKTEKIEAEEEGPEVSYDPVPEERVHRVLFNEITKKSVQQAISNPLKLDERLFDAQQARRVLDRLVGYQISPLLWDKVRRGLSAGRVQSVAVRIICEREEEIENFKSVEYWSVHTLLEGSAPPPFSAKLLAKDGNKLEISNGEQAEAIRSDLEKAKFVLKEIVRKERRRQPAAPFITSTLQQESARKLGFTAKKTMMLAQRLYEGVELGDGELVGLITYMRTDSTRLSDDALKQVRDYIRERYDATYLPEQPVVYKTKKAAQDAHEAIRPTSTEYAPEAVKAFLEPDELKLYELIWKRFVACQMQPAIYDQTSLNIGAGAYDLRATGSVIKFPGFMAVYIEGKDEATSEDEEEGNTLPVLQEGETLKLLEITPEQHFTQPPPRYTEASLVKELEEKGIGRPSTYATILSTIQDKKYATKEAGKFFPTQLGKIVNELLVSSFPDILNVQFTAKMEGELDDVEEGKRKWSEAIADFYGPFQETLKKAKVHMKDIKRQEISTEFKCEKCGSPMVVKWGRHGEFLACSGYPECKSTKEIVQAEGGGYAIAEEQKVEEVCEKCGSPMQIKRGRFGSFLACSSYPNCKTTKAISIGVNCPQCNSPLAERRSKRGKVFYGCTGYPKCTFALWDKPVKEACPQCKAPYLLQKFSKKEGEKLKCANKECGYERVKEAPVAAEGGA
ncbi:MAG: type I DNA topoisomerase [bacterium]